MKKLEGDRRRHRFSLVDKKNDISREDLATSMAEYSPTIIEAAKALAIKTETVYVETPLLSYEQLTNEEDYPVGSAAPPGSNPFQQSGPSVADTVFGSPLDELQFFIPRQAQRNAMNLDSDESRYIWWITDVSPAHLPALDEPGIREEVVLAWKRSKARELAKSRAEQLAKEIREELAKPEDQRKSMAASLDAATVSGDADSPKLTTRRTKPFTWVRQEMTPQMNFSQRSPQLVLSEIAYDDESGDVMELAYHDFMNAVFNDLKNNEIGVVPNADLSRYFVVEVTDRNPTPEVGEDVLRQRFLTEGKQFVQGGSPVVAMVRQAVSDPVAIKWEKILWRKYGIDPDAEPQPDPTALD
jgi:hypothetical protein